MVFAVAVQTKGLSYDRSDRLDLRRPIMARWGDFICPDSNVIDIKREVA